MPTTEKKLRGEKGKRGGGRGRELQGQFAENFRNATPRSTRNEISQRILIQERPRGIADVSEPLDTQIIRSLLSEQKRDRERLLLWNRVLSREIVPRCIGAIFFHIFDMQLRDANNID